MTCFVWQFFSEIFFFFSLKILTALVIEKTFNSSECFFLLFKNFIHETEKKKSSTKVSAVEFFAILNRKLDDKKKSPWINFKAFFHYSWGFFPIKKHELHLEKNQSLNLFGCSIKKKMKKKAFGKKNHYIQCEKSYQKICEMLITKKHPSIINSFFEI